MVRRWNWQQDDWRQFTWNDKLIIPYEEQFLHNSGLMLGVSKYLNEEDSQNFIVEMMTDEAIKTSEIEGEYLNRDSVQSSILNNLGLTSNKHQANPSEQGVADMMGDLYQNSNEPLTENVLFRWHKMLMTSRDDLKNIGAYRTHGEPMQVISDRMDKPKIHFEAPPSEIIQNEMQLFLEWWQQSSTNQSKKLSPLTRSAIAHLYFVCIHPFEDGNGRIARALSEKSLAESQGKPTYIALSQIIHKNRKNYYEALARNNKINEITDWLVYFSQTILEAQQYSLDMINFSVEKTKLYDRVRDELNPRQHKALKRVFKEGLNGFEGGMSAKKYISITGASKATATRDLQDLIEKQVFFRTGKLKNTRYHLTISRN